MDQIDPWYYCPACHNEVPMPPVQKRMDRVVERVDELERLWRIAMGHIDTLETEVFSPEENDDNCCP